MGMGAPKDKESHEVTVELEGEVSQEAFDAYIAQLRECLAKLALLTDKKNGDCKLKVRQIRARIVRRG